MNIQGSKSYTIHSPGLSFTELKLMGNGDVVIIKIPKQSAFKKKIMESTFLNK